MKKILFFFPAFSIWIAVFAFLFLIVGCSKKNNTGPLDDENLRLISVSGKNSPRLEIPKDHIIYDLDEQQKSKLDSLIESLRPLKSVKNGNLSSKKIDFSISFQAGMDPLTIDVQLAGDQLVYSERNYIYEGGNAKAFRELADSIIAACRERKNLKQPRGK